jgi:hypothetical protein
VPRRLRWPSQTHDDFPRPPIKSVEEQQRCKSRQSSHQRSPALSSPWLLRRCPSRGPCCLPRMSYSRGQSFPLKTCCHRRMSFQPGIFFLPRIFSQRGHSWPLKTYTPLGLCCRSTGSTSMTLACRWRRECLGQFSFATRRRISPKPQSSLPYGAISPERRFGFRSWVTATRNHGNLHWEQMESSPRTSVTWRMRALVKSFATLRPPPRGWVFLTRPHRSNLLSLPACSLLELVSQPAYRLCEPATLCPFGLAIARTLRRASLRSAPPPCRSVAMPSLLLL